MPEPETFLRMTNQLALLFDTANACRLCGGALDLAFRKQLINKYVVSFYRCRACGSLQSEQPYWLEEAYGPSVQQLDMGAAQRVLHCLPFIHVVMKLFRCTTALDYGGGSGLLCRLLRDIGHDVYWYDRYTSPGYASGFVGSPDAPYDLITSIEVVEHFCNPREDLDVFFSNRPKIVLMMTELYTGQGADWWYLAPSEGQHVFFYSPSAVALIGERYGYYSLICGGFLVFLRERPTALQRVVLTKLLRPRVLRWIKTALIAGSAPGAQADFEKLNV